MVFIWLHYLDPKEIVITFPQNLIYSDSEVWWQKRCTLTQYSSGVVSWHSVCLMWCADITHVARCLIPCQKSSLSLVCDLLGGLGGFAGKYISTSMKQRVAMPVSAIDNHNNVITLSDSNMHNTKATDMEVQNLLTLRSYKFTLMLKFGNSMQ